jgi:thymidylate kinase
MNNLNAFISFLKKNRNYVLLRNSDVKENLIKGGDADILVVEFKKYMDDFLSLVELPLMYIERSYLHAFFWKWGHVDIFTSIEIRGANFISKEIIISERIINANKLLEAPLHVQALVCWISNLLLGGFFKMRYKSIIIQAAQESGEALYNSLEYAVGPVWAQRMLSLACEERPEDSEKWIHPLRRALWWRAFKRAPCTTLIRWADYWKNQISRCTNPPAPWIAILGLDGSGKSTLARHIKKSLGCSKPFMDVKIAHWRPEFFHNSRNMSPVIEPHGKSKRGTILSMAKLGFLVLDWLFGFWQCVLLPRAKGQLVIFDRHYVDLLVDPRRYRYGAPAWIARLVSTLIPKPDLFILLDLPAEAAHSRKPEVPLDEARRLRQRYLDLTQGLANGHVVDAVRPIGEVVGEVEEIILTELQKQTAARMCRAGLL